MNKKDIWIGVGALVCGVIMAAGLHLLLRRPAEEAVPVFDSATWEGGAPPDASVPGSASQPSGVRRASENTGTSLSRGPAERQLPAVAPAAAHVPLSASQGIAALASTQPGKESSEPSGKVAEPHNGGDGPGRARDEDGRLSPGARAPTEASEAAVHKALAEAGKAMPFAAANYNVPELANLSGMLASRNPLAAMSKIRKAIPLARRLDGMSRDFSKLVEQYNQKREALQSSSGPKGPIRQEMATLESSIKKKMADIQPVQRDLDALIGKSPPVSPQDKILPPLAGVSPRAQVALQTAYAQLGKPYVWGSAGTKNFDCSGLLLYSWRAAGLSMPHSAAMQSRLFPRVPTSALQPGDLVYFGNPVHHIGMYVGDGKMIHAPRTGDVVRIGPIGGSDYSGANRP